jgi:hypothetical protein
MTDLPFPLEGSALVLGPSRAGKTTVTARALDAWVDEHGADGVVVLDFAPELERDGALLGGRLSRFTDLPERAFHGLIDARAPRAESGGDDAVALELAADNARRGATLLAGAPDDPEAVFVNDATIPFQHESGEPARLTDYCDRAAVSVCNAFDGEELGTDDPVSRRERTVVDTLGRWADRVVRLD